MSTITLKTERDTQLIVMRSFAAPPEAVNRAHTDPKLIQKWLLAPEGWTDASLHQRGVKARIHGGPA